MQINNKSAMPIQQVYWYINKPLNPPLKENITVDVLIIGGGMAGLSAAQAFHEKGLRVALIEKNFCGAGASGKSSGFITPDSEFALHNLIDFYGNEVGKRLWEFSSNGVALIEKNIHQHKISCDYQKQNTLVIASSHHAFNSSIKAEYQARKQFNYAATLYEKDRVPSILGSSSYYGAIEYPDTFGIHAYAYCQEMKTILTNAGVLLYEDTPLTSFTTNGAQTPHATITADKVIVCIDRFINDYAKLLSQVYHVQTFLMMSEPVSDQVINALFPARKFMVWDTNLIYNYFRCTGDNRLMLGGARLLSTYAPREHYHNKKIIKKLSSYFKKSFPQVDIQFNYIWPGLIGITKDIMPIAGPDKQHPHIYYISGAAGLPWAAALGVYSAQHILENRTDLDVVFSPERHFALGSCAQKLLGTPLTFALCNFMRTRSL